MDIHIELKRNEPKYLQLYEQLKNSIVTGILQSDEKLPSKRSFAADLHVSIHTVQQAYEQLLSEGYIYSKERSGYFVAPYDIEWGTPTVDVCFEQPQPIAMNYNFKNGQVDELAFPFKQWLKLYKQHLEPAVVANSSWQGEFSLRQQIVYYLQKVKGIQCHPEQVFISSGTQQQLQAICQFFGAVDVAMEEPGFHRATAVFHAQHLQVEAVPIDQYGATIPSSTPRLYYVTPAHQFPLGAVMSMERKQQLLKWAQQTTSYLIEDDYDSEFRYKGNPIPPLAQLDQLHHVIYFGSFSKTLMPSLRISYFVLPTALVQPFQLFYAAHKSLVSKVDQLTIASFMEEGYYARHIAKMRTLYRKKRARLIAALKQHVGEQVNVLGEAAGLHIVLQLPAHLPEQTAIVLARQYGIAIDAVSTNYQCKSDNQYVMLGYGAIALEQIEEAVQLLAQAWNY